MTDTSNADFSPDAGHFEELPDEAHSPQWIPNRPPIPSSPQNLQPAFQPANQPQFQIPGQSSNVWNRGRDQPTTVGGQPPPRQPQHPPNMGPGGDPRYNQFPPGTRLPPPPAIQPYSMPFPNRQSSDWGTPDQFANTPQQFELPSLFRHLGGYFAQNGMGRGGLVGGMLMQIFSNSYQKAAMRGNLEQMKLYEEQLNLNNAMLEENEQRGMIEFSDIINEYESAANQTDPDKMGNFAINGMDMRHALELKAAELGNKPLQDLLNSGAPMSRIVQYMQTHDANWRALHAANKTANKDATTAKDLADWGVPGASANDVPGSPGQGTAPPPMSGIQIGMGPSAPASPDPNAPSAQAQPTSASQPETQGDRVAAMPEYQRQGIELLRGGNMTGVPKDVQPYVKKFANDTLGQIDDLVAKAKSGKMTKDQIEQELRKINPAIAGEFAGIRDLDTPLPGGIAATGANPFWRDIASLAEASVPGWRANDYAVTGEMQRDYTSGTSSRRMQAANNMADAAVPLLKALKNIPEGELPPVNWLDDIMAKKFTGDPKWVTLFNAVQMYVQESQSLASPTGRYFEGDVNRLMHEFNLAMGTKAIRSVLATDADAASRRIQTLTDDYENTTRKPYPPHYNPKSTAIINALAKLDPNKGFADVSDLPPDLQGLGMGATAAPSAADPVAPPASGWSLTPP